MKQGAFEFYEAVRVVKAWVRPAVMTFKPWNAPGPKEDGWTAQPNKRVTLAQWLEWHSPLSANWEGCEA